ncbi:MAG: glycosyltransferase family 39 protein [Bacteroidales bacterium]|nr:glycosyltransferase family 39 protein [Bacteroidales bacterium]
MCPGLIFFLALIVISLLYYYHIIILSPPQSIHRWRQTDCTSITLNYYQHGMKFFRPEVHSLVSDGYTTGYAAGEAPVLYYFIAALYRVTGPDDTVYRIANTLVFYIGLFALFKISSFFLQDKFLAAFIPLLIFTSPVAAYYGCNYLPDTAALTFVFLGWLQFLKYYSGNQYWKYLLSVVFFGLAGLLKISMSINLVALTGFIFLHHIKTMQLPGNLTLRNALKKYLPLITGGCIITGWYLYAVRYNDYHDATTFLTGTRPWWDLAADERQDITRFIMDNNLSLYFSHAVLYFLAACLILTVAWFKKIQKLLVIITGLLLTGGLIFVNFWYSQFQYHDYYFITLFAPLAFLIITAMTGLRTCCEKILQSWWFRVALIAFLIFNVFHARHEIKLRYFGWKREAPVYEEYFTIRPHLGSMGIRPNDRVISIPDVTSCYTLYMMNQPGNNLPGINRSTAGDIKKFIGLGARYLFVNDTALVNDPILQEFLKVRIGNVKNVHIFRLDSLDSFNLKP